jgi:hypothetical protein
MLRLILRENPDAGESAEDPGERLRMRAHRLGQLGTAFRLLAQEIGQPELSSNGDQLRDHGPIEHLEQHASGRRRGRRMAIIWSGHQQASRRRVTRRRSQYGQQG